MDTDKRQRDNDRVINDDIFVVWFCVFLCLFLLLLLSFSSPSSPPLK